MDSIYSQSKSPNDAPQRSQPLALRLQSWRLVDRVAELGSFGEPTSITRHAQR